MDRVQEVIRETAKSRSKLFTSRYGLTQSEALEAGEQWLGEGYRTRDAEQWVFRSADGARGFRIDPPFRSPEAISLGFPMYTSNTITR